MLDLIRHGEILELNLARPPANALDPELVGKLRVAIESAPAHGVRALLLSGRPGMFSAGLDVPVLLRLDRNGMTAFWHEFFGLCAALARSPIPIAAAIGGHSPAGGAVLAIFCDYRVMANGPFKIGLNEVQIGLSVPGNIQFALRRLVGTYRAERLLVVGAMVDASEALRVGFVDEVVEPEQVVPRTREWLEGLLKLPAQAMTNTRHIARADLAEVFADARAFAIDEFVDAWFSAESQATLKALVARLKGGK
ncbi:MAG TPA: enoyl-CoA hydratase/isomerase family protein [Rudaea sp.]|jgi:enoyl-CoA hydratase/carnithine racemase|uniref:enoyl-CoA hydratase/isomerase family protein n=1 Tax=Rudaea sp. TaxID=2136325 RepID=UPI002F928F93